MRNRYVILSYFLIAVISFVSANPNILTYDNSHWYNDRGEDRTADINQANATWNTISYPNPWVVEMTNPLLKYNSDLYMYTNYENITIEKAGMETIYITADTTVTLTVIP